MSLLLVWATGQPETDVPLITRQSYMAAVVAKPHCIASKLRLCGLLGFYCPLKGILSTAPRLRWTMLLSSYDQTLLLK